MGSVVQWLCLEEGAGLLLAQRPPRDARMPWGGILQSVLVVQGWEAAEPLGASAVMREPCAEPCPSRDSTGGARWAAGPLSQPRDTELIHSQLPPPLRRGLPASLLARAEGRRRDSRGHGEHRGLYLLFALGNPMGAVSGAGSGGT